MSDPDGVDEPDGADEPDEETPLSDLAERARRGRDDASVDDAKRGAADERHDAGGDEDEWERPFEATDAAGDADGEPSPSEESERAEGEHAEGERAGRTPLSDLAAEVQSRRDAHSDEGPDETPFEEMDVGEVDEEAIWDELFGDEGSDTEKRLGMGAEAERVGGTAEYDEYVVDKGEFCKQCPYLGDPPTLACTHEGTTIVEVVGSEHFRVRDCPMVEPDEMDITDVG